MLFRSLTFTQEFENNWDMNMTLHYTDGKGYYEDYKTRRKFKEYGLTEFTDAAGTVINRTDLIRQKWLSNDFYGAVANVNYTGERLRTTLGLSGNIYDGDHYGYVVWAKNYNNLLPNHEYYRSNGKKKEFSGFAKANYMFTEHLSGYADVQYRFIDYKTEGTDDKAGEIFVDKQYNFVNPKVGLNYNNKGHNAYASFAMANREPNRNNFTEAGPEEQPTYETLFDYELGYSFSNKWLNIGANLYWMQYDNQLIITGELSEIGEALTTNIKDSYRRGIELTAAVKACRFFEWNGNVAFS